jgi:hypothetical protein
LTIIISSRLFDVHGKLAKGAVYWSPDRQEFASYSMVGFVDDTWSIDGGSKDQGRTIVMVLDFSVEQHNILEGGGSMVQHEW